MVSKVAVIIYETTVKNVDNKVRESIRIGGLLHDIGKCTEHFQKLLKKQDTEETIKDCGSYNIRHNELGWMFLKNNFNHKQKNDILDVVYWHHGISPNNFKPDGFYKGDIIISDVDTNNMKEFLSEVIGDDFFMVKNLPEPFKRPHYFIASDDFNDEVNEKKLLMRSCIISADRIVSSNICKNLNDGELRDFIRNYNTTSTSIDINTHTFNSISNERFQQQIDITKQIINDTNRTHIIKAPGGFGKTITGLLWSLQRNRRLIWVCPRNDIAKSVYRSLINELSGFNNGESVRVELYLSGEVKEQTHDNDGYTSDIIITNIDNFLNPTVDNRYSDRLFTVIESDVVFDEYHELVSDNALFSLFILMMRIRHQQTNSSTLLLSATPGVIERLWDNSDNVTCVLPNKETHFKSQHNKKYKIRVVENFEDDSLENSSALIMNSITNSQRIKKRFNVPILYHSNFVKKDRDGILNTIFETYDKNSNRSDNKLSVSSTHVLQASLDISFLNLHESVLSPESTVQRFCRCDRFGDYDGQSTFTIFKNIESLEVGERKMRDTLYREDLTELWFNHMKQYNDSELTMDEIFQIYNEYIGKMRTELEIFGYKKFIFGLSKLSEIYPLKFNFKTKGSKVKTAGSNKLRNSNGNEIFVIAPYYNDSKQYSDPISVDTYGNFLRTFNEKDGMEKKIVNIFKLLEKDGRFDYDELLKINKYGNLNIDQIRKYAKRDNMPYVRFDKVYHPEYGFVYREII
jgi:CRISPR-associated endonuclease Cas3-HD